MLGKELITLKHSYKCHGWTLITTEGYSFSDVYATEGNFGIYNILIMEEKQTIVAIGAGTITKRVFGDGRIERVDSVKDVGLYIEKIDEMIERKRNLLSE